MTTIILPGTKEEVRIGKKTEYVQPTLTITVEEGTVYPPRSDVRNTEQTFI